MNLSLSLFFPLFFLQMLDADIVKDNFLSKRVISRSEEKKKEKKKNFIFARARQIFIHFLVFGNVITGVLPDCMYVDDSGRANEIGRVG